jgi:SAM-dependent methyltransferase
MVARFYLGLALTPSCGRARLPVTGQHLAQVVVRLRAYIRPVSFDVAADAYGRFMGQYSEPLAERFMDFVGAQPGQQALDVGCGPGALTAELVERLGADSVAAIDPSAPFVSAVHARFPEVDVRSGAAEQLPFADDSFDVAVAQLVVHFMTDPVAGLREMTRVTRPSGVVAASVWDHAGGGGPLATFWRAVTETDPGAHDESALAGAREGHLAQLCAAAGLTRIDSTALTVTVHYPTFDDWWQPYTLGVGPAGAYVAQLDDVRRDALRTRCADALPRAPFDVAATAWCVQARP